MHTIHDAESFRAATLKFHQLLRLGDYSGEDYSVRLEDEIANGK